MASLADSRTNTKPRSASRGERRAANLDVEIRGAGQNSTTNVRNVSARGLLIHSSAPIAVGEALRVDLPQGGMTEATVVWADGNLYGCEFARPITPGVVSAAILKSKPAPGTDSIIADPLALGASAGAEELNARTKLFTIVGLALLSWLPLFGLMAILS